VPALRMSCDAGEGLEEHMVVEDSFASSWSEDVAEHRAVD
jgi:hypothetical protein